MTNIITEYAESTNVARLRRVFHIQMWVKLSLFYKPMILFCKINITAVDIILKNNKEIYIRFL